MIEKTDEKRIKEKTEVISECETNEQRQARQDKQNNLGQTNTIKTRKNMILTITIAHFSDNRAHIQLNRSHARLFTFGLKRV